MKRLRQFVELLALVLCSMQIAFKINLIDDVIYIRIYKHHLIQFRRTMSLLKCSPMFLSFYPSLYDSVYCLISSNYRDSIEYLDFQIIFNESLWDECFKHVVGHKLSLTTKEYKFG